MPETQYSRRIITVGKGDLIDILGDVSATTMRINFLDSSRFLVDLVDPNGQLVRGGSFEIMIVPGYASIKLNKKDEKMSEKEALYEKLGHMESYLEMLRLSFKRTLELNMPGDYFSMDFSGFNELFERLDTDIKRTMQEIKKLDGES